MVKRGYKYIELDKDRVLGLSELLVIESYHNAELDDEFPWRVVLHPLKFEGFADGYALFHITATYWDDKCKGFVELSHLLKSVSENKDKGSYSFHYVVPVYIPVKHLEERLSAYGFSLQSLDRRYMELEVMLEESWTNPLWNVESVGLNVFYKDLLGNPMPKGF